MSCAPGTKWDCVNESVFGGAGDVDYLLASTTVTLQFELDTVAMSGATVTNIAISTRSACASGTNGSLGVRLYNSANTALTSVQALPVPSTVTADATTVDLPVLLDQTTLDGAYMQIAITRCSSSGSVVLIAASVDVDYEMLTSTTLHPNAEKSVAAGTTATGCSSPNRHLCINSAGTSSYLRFDDTPRTSDFEMETVAGINRVASVQLFARYKCTFDAVSGPGPALSLRRADGSVIAGPFTATPQPDSTWRLWSSSIVSTSLTQSELDGAYLRMTTDYCQDAFYLQIEEAGINITYSTPGVAGTATDDLGAAWGPCDGVTANGVRAPSSRRTVVTSEEGTPPTNRRTTPCP